MIYYALGFCFSPDAKYIVLIAKNRPGFLVGLNGIGGQFSVALGDASLLDTQRREFREETGVDIPEWREFARVFTTKPDLSEQVQISCFSVRSPRFDICRTMTDEVVDFYRVDTIQELQRSGVLLPMVEWIIPLALEARFTAEITLTRNVQS